MRDINGVEFRETKDHSKWAVTAKTIDQWVCIGDINRQEHQRLRAGGTICTQDVYLCEAFFQLVGKIEKCHLLQLANHL